MSKDCRVCEKIKAEYLAAREHINRVKEDFIIGSLIMFFFGSVLELIISRFFLALLRMIPSSDGGSVLAGIFSMKPGWWVMVSFVSFLGLSITGVVLKLFFERRRDYREGKNRLGAAVKRVKSECCSDCRNALPAAL